nr:putative reverse transcriptase domain-containing protein [Tanacetum cinerariifolium]
MLGNVQSSATSVERLGTKQGAIELRRWFEKMEMTFRISEGVEDKKIKFVAATLRGPELTWWNSKVIILGLDKFNEMDLMCPRMVEPKRVKDAYIRGLMDNIKGEVTSSKPADLNEAVHMAHKLMEQKSQARDARILDGKKQKWESLQGRNSSGKGNQRYNSRHTLQDSQKQVNARAMVTAPTDGKLPLCKWCLLAMFASVRSSVTSVERFMKCNPAVFRGVEGAVELRRWFEKTESVFEISECIEGKKVKFATATLEGPALTW